MRRKWKRRRQRLAAAVALSLAITCQAAPAWADITSTKLVTGVETITDNITITSNQYALYVSDPGAHAFMTGLSISVNPPVWHNVYGALAINSGEIDLTNVTINTTGPGTGYHGLVAQSDGKITMTGGSITTTGVNSYGVFTPGGGGRSTLTNVAVRTNGTGSHGLTAGAAGGTIAMTGGSITTTGDGSSGAAAIAIIGPTGGTAVLTNVAVLTTGANSHGAYANAGGTVTLTNTAISATGAGSYGLRADGGTVTATVDGQDIAGTGGLLAASGGGTVSLTANGSSRLTGITGVTTGGTANLTLNGGATWTVPGNSALTTLTLSGGTIGFTAPTAGGPYKTLTVGGNLAGVGGNLAGVGGTLRLNANLNTGLADLVSVGGTARGSYQFYINNSGGTPASPYQAVKVVDLVNEGAAHTATFGGGSDVGAYRYGVAQGTSLSNSYTYSGSSVSASSDYYLYNTFGPSATSQAAIGLSSDTVVAWYGEMNEIKKRMGDLRMGVQSSDDFWVRGYADKFNIRPGGGTAAYSQIMRGVEIGKDNPRAFAGGKKYTGLVFGTGKADNTYSAGGSGTTHSTYAGAYASWLRDDGSYVDLIGKYNWFNHRFDTPVLGGVSDRGRYSNKGLGLSAEVGKRFDKGNGAYVEPAAELAALWADKASYTTANGLAVQTPSVRSLQLRLGLTAGQKRTDSDGITRQFYGKAAWVNEFKGDSTVRVDTASFDASLKGHQWVTGLGYIEDNGQHQLYLDVEKSWGNTTSKQWGWNAGWRWKF